MTKRELRELIRSMIREYIGTSVQEQLGDMASTGATSDDGIILPLNVLLRAMGQN